MKQFMDKIAGWPILRFFLNSEKIGTLVLKCLLLLLIPYVYLMFCGLVFDQLLKLYMMTTFIFVSLCVLAAITLFLLVLALIRFPWKSSQ